MQQTDWEPNIWSRICSTHFPDSCLYESKNGRRRLTSNAVPSLFIHPSPSHSSSSNVIADPANTSLTDTPRKKKLKNEINRLNDIAKRRRQRLNAVLAANRRLKKKVSS